MKRNRHCIELRVKESNEGVTVDQNSEERAKLKTFVMHSIEELGTNVPAFLAKLWKIVEDPETNDLICWSPSGNSFFIRDQARFSRELLPLYYKHNNMASFVRQLNMYGFHKVVSIEGGGLKVDKDEMEFAHQCFLMGHPYLLEHIKRKIPTSKVEADTRTTTKPEIMNKILSDVKGLKGRQDSVDSQLDAMKRENEVLWQEVALLRQKHLKQQQIVNKLIQFLVSMVQTSRGSGGIGLKRHYPLMINNISHHSKKVPKLNVDLSEQCNEAESLSPSGPVIHELDPADFLETCVPAEDLDDDPLMTEEMETGQVHSPSSCASSVKSTAAQSISETSPIQLLELSDDCPLSPEILIAASPLAINPAIITPRITKRSRETKKRKSRKSSGGNKVRVVAKQLEESENNGVDGVDFSNILPTVEASLLFKPEKSAAAKQKEGEKQESSQSIEAATDAAISAINSVAAASDVKLDRLLAHGISPSCADNEQSNMTVACTTSDTADNTGVTREKLDSHLDTMQCELDSLKDLLGGEGYSLDANTLLGVCPGLLSPHQDLLKLFNEDPVSYELPALADEESSGRVSGNELMTYSSNLMDLADMFGTSGGEWSPPATPSPSNHSDISLSELNTPQMVLVSPGFVSSSSSSSSKKRK